MMGNEEYSRFVKHLFMITFRVVWSVVSVGVLGRCRRHTDNVSRRWAAGAVPSKPLVQVKVTVADTSARRFNRQTHERVRDPEEGAMRQAGHDGQFSCCS